MRDIVQALNNDDLATLLSEISAGRFDPGFVDGDGRTLIDICILRSSREALRALVHAGASLETRPHHDFYPLLESVVMGREDMVDELLNLGADPNVREDELGQTALTLAAKFARVEITKRLLDCAEKLNTRAKDHRGRTALHWLAIHGNSDKPDDEFEMARMLLGSGLTCMEPDILGSTPLAYAQMTRKTGLATLMRMTLGSE